jgi:hypothetical protein
MKKQYRDIRDIIDLSGFGQDSGYENACQKMLQKGYEWLQEHPNAILTAKSYKNVYGIFDPESVDAKKLSGIIVKEVPDCSGAMHQMVMLHLFYIHQHGVDKWIKDVREKRDE